MNCHHELKELQQIYTKLQGWNKNLDQEMEQVFISQNETVLLMYTRRAVEIIVGDLVTQKLKRKRGTEPLSGLIDKLNHEDLIPCHIYTSLKSLNQTGNFGAHPTEFNSRQVRSAIIEFQTILEWILVTEKPAKSDTIIPDDDNQNTFQEEKVYGNPFLNRSAIQNPEFFIGRQDLISKIFSRISHEKPQSISLWGDSRIGKSCILANINNGCVQNKYIKNSSNYIFLYIDLQGLGHNGPTGFFEALFASLPQNRNATTPWVSRSSGYQEIEQFLQNCSSKNIKVIILLDEFQIITKNPAFDYDFYSSLRALATNFNLAFVIASFSRLHELCCTRKIAGSPFFNIFHPFNVGPFTRSESVLLIEKYLEKVKAPFSFTIYYDLIFSETGYLPFYIQIFCTLLYEKLVQGDLLDIQKNIIVEYLDEVRDHFFFLWSNMSAEEKTVVSKVVFKHHITNEKELNIVSKLILKGYIQEINQELFLFSNSFKAFLLKSNCMDNKKFDIRSVFKTLFKSN